jgi:hypothetical protein
MVVSRRFAALRMRSASSVEQRNNMVVLGPGEQAACVAMARFNPLAGFILANNDSSNATALITIFNT